MRLLLLCEGDAETAHGSFSGSAYSLLTNLRMAGHTVHAADTDLLGIRRYLAAGVTFTPDRRRWGVRYRLGGIPFRLRSANAAAGIRQVRGIDAILQIGATFAPWGRGEVPYFLYCDSNIRMAERGTSSGQSQAASLNDQELNAVVRREAEVYQGATAVFTLSQRLRQSFIEDFGLAPERVHTVHAGPNLDVTLIPNRLGRPAGAAPTILFVGVKFERKGGDLLLRAFELVRRVMPEARLRIVGPRTLDTSVPGVELLGFLRKDVPQDWARLVEAYSDADVFCLPTRFEPFGIVFIEAMFFGLPCIGPDAWAIPEMIVDRETGFLVPPEDPDVLADRLLRLLQDPDLARAMGAAGRARAQSNFTWEKVARRMTDVMVASTLPVR